jgi:hypothetical protein
MLAISPVGTCRIPPMSRASNDRQKLYPAHEYPVGLNPARGLDHEGVIERGGRTLLVCVEVPVDVRGEEDGRFALFDGRDE